MLVFGGALFFPEKRIDPNMDDFGMRSTWTKSEQRSICLLLSVDVERLLDPMG